MEITSDLLSVTVIGAVMNSVVPPDPDDVPKKERSSLPYLIPSIYHEAMHLFMKVKDEILLSEVNIFH